MWQPGPVSGHHGAPPGLPAGLMSGIVGAGAPPGHAPGAPGMVPGMAPGMPLSFAPIPGVPGPFLPGMLGMMPPAMPSPPVSHGTSPAGSGTAYPGGFSGSGHQYVMPNVYPGYAALPPGLPPGGKLVMLPTGASPGGAPGVPFMLPSHQEPSLVHVLPGGPMMLAPGSASPGGMPEALSISGMSSSAGGLHFGSSGGAPPGRTSMGASTSTRPPSDTHVWGFAVVDPYHTTLQRIPVPPSVVSPSRGLALYNNDVTSSSQKPCTSHVCVKHLSPLGCPVGEACSNFHIDPSYIEAARAVTDPLCCGLHNDYFTQRMLKDNCAKQFGDATFTVVLEDRSEVELLRSQLAFTTGLDNLTLRGNTRVINLRKHICRLHLEGKCKWTKDCGHVHLCRELHRCLSTFHYPSFFFLLSTETDTNALLAKIKSGPQFVDFLKSRSALRTINALLEQNRPAALAACIQSGAVLTNEQAAMAVKLGAVASVPQAQILTAALPPHILPPPRDPAPPAPAATPVAAVPVGESE